MSRLEFHPHASPIAPLQLETGSCLFRDIGDKPYHFVTRTDYTEEESVLTWYELVDHWEENGKSSYTNTKLVVSAIQVLNDGTWQLDEHSVPVLHTTKIGLTTAQPEKGQYYSDIMFTVAAFAVDECHGSYSRNDRYRLYEYNRVRNRYKKNRGLHVGAGYTTTYSPYL